MATLTLTLGLALILAIVLIAGVLASQDGISPQWHVGKSTDAFSRASRTSTPPHINRTSESPSPKYGHRERGRECHRQQLELFPSSTTKPKNSRQSPRNCGSASSHSLPNGRKVTAILP
jgi:hypothetical protein